MTDRSRSEQQPGRSGPRSDGGGGGEQTHPGLEELVDYYALALEEPAELRVEQHLASCASCAAEARAVRRAERLFDSWTARSHGEAALRDLLARGLAAARGQVADPGLAARLASWVGRWTGRTEATARLVFGARGQLPRLEPISFGAGPPPPPAAPYAAPARAALWAGNPASGGTARAELVVGSAPRARLAVPTGRRELTVQIDRLALDRPPPMVLLVDLAGEGDARLALVEREPNAAGGSAHFVDLSAGEYLVAVEPLP